MAPSPSLLQSRTWRRIRTVRRQPTLIIGDPRADVILKEECSQPTADTLYINRRSHPTEFIDPCYRNTNWQGLTWKERRRRPLRAMNRWVRAKDYAGLEEE